jgi:HAD superfamily hydrolase (TIGR01509 family)
VRVPFDAPRGVVFDNDGLLLDTEPCWSTAQESLFAAHGRSFGLADKHELVGTSPVTAAPILARLLGQPAQAGQSLSDEMYALALTEIASGATPREGAVDLVTRLNAVGTPVGVASNAPRRHLLAGLRRVGLDEAFDVVMGVDDVDNPKPAPDLYLTACAALGVAPADAIGLEDSPPGVAAAKTAGLWVIGIPSIPGVVLHADMVARSLADPEVHRALGLRE